MPPVLMIVYCAFVGTDFFAFKKEKEGKAGSAHYPRSVPLLTLFPV